MKKQIVENTILFIMGVSGSGKGTVLKDLFKEYTILKRVQSYTSRDMREGEVDGDQYFFVNKENFEKGIENNEFLEYAHVHKKNYYGTKIKDIKEKFEEGCIPVKEIDMIGLEKLKKEDNSQFNYFSIFLDVPEETMIKRINGRQEISQEELDRRLQSAHDERKKAKKLCNVIIDASGTPEEVLELVKEKIDQELLSNKELFQEGTLNLGKQKLILVFILFILINLFIFLWIISRFLKT